MKKKKAFVKKRPTKRVYPVMRVAQPENKYFDYQNYITFLNTGNLFYNLTAITTQGVGEGQRIGNSVHIKTIQIRWILEADAAAAVNHQCRIIIIQDKQGVNAPVALDVFETGDLSSNYAPIARYNEGYYQRFHILKNVYMVTGPSHGFTRMGVINIKYNTKTSYIGGSTFKNQVYMCAFSGTSNVLQAPTLRWTSRVTYIDA